MDTILARLHHLRDAERARSDRLRDDAAHAHGDAYVRVLLAANRQLGRVEMLDGVIAFLEGAAVPANAGDEAA